MSQNNVAYEMLTAEFPDSEIKSFNQAKAGQPARWLSYVPDETVMGRLDAIFGPGGWNFNAEPTAFPGVAVVTMGVKWPDNAEWTYYSDFGYPTNGDRGEALKEAVSDGIRRCARFVGVARYIYAGEHVAIPSGRQPSPSPSQPRPVAPSGGSGAAPSDDFDMADVDNDHDATCAKHGERWFGKPYTPDDHRSGRYHKDGVWEDSGKTKWCRHPADEAAKKASR